MFDALFFDLDGTLIDTETLALATGIAAFAAHGLTVEESFMHGLIGKDEPTSSALIRAAFPGLDLGGVRADWGSRFETGVEAGLPLKPGVTELLRATEGLPRAIVTSTGRPGAHRKLRIAGLEGLFDHVITLHDVTAPKPDPAPYLLAAEKVGLPAVRCLVFEDSETGAEAAHRAGCTVVQVPDVIAATGRWAHHVAPDLIAGARMAGLF